MSGISRGTTPFLAVLALGCGLAWPTAVHALSCEDFRFLAPADGAHVPPDALIWTDFLFGDDILVVSTSGVRVFLEEERFLTTVKRNLQVRTFKPREDLVVGWSYEIYRREKLVSTFTVVEGGLPDLPPIPQATHEGESVGSEEYSSVGHRFRLPPRHSCTWSTRTACRRSPDRLRTARSTISWPMSVCSSDESRAPAPAGISQTTSCRCDSERSTSGAVFPAGAPPRS